MTAARLDQDRLAATAAGIEAPDVVIACSQHGQRTLVTAGTARRDPATLANLRYEIGSASKTFTGLLLAHLAHRRIVDLTDPLARYLSPRSGHTHGDAISLFHLITHTSGLPRQPRDLYRHALPRWLTNPYAGYTTDRLVDAFASTRLSGRPGACWRYSNFGAALLGPALARATATPFEPLLTENILVPLRLTSTALAPHGQAHDATGHGYRTGRIVPAFDAAAFVAAGAVRATPGDLLTYLEAHLYPDRVPALEQALRRVREPAIRRGLRYQHSHTLTWFRHPYDDGPIFFHGGATLGQEAFIGFRPATRTAVVAVSTRRYRPGGNLQKRAYELLL
jgi:CubicO group peptidase (beta-lactamase class C family)